MRLVIALFVNRMLAKATFDKIRGGRIDELVDTLAMAAPDETGLSDASIAPPSPLAKTQFRLILAQYTTRDTTAAGGLRYRLRKLRYGMELTAGNGKTPPVHPHLPPAAFDDLEKPFTAADGGIDELFTRYFAVKLDGMAFCGRAFYDLPVTEGFFRLALMYPITMYVARWIACADGRSSMTGKDAQKALTIVDHHHGYSPAMGMANFGKRARWLVEHDEIPRLAVHYTAAMPQ
jgi:lysine-N-methylase